MTPRPLPYGRQCIEEDDVQAVTDALRGDWLTQGPGVARFEEALAERCGAPYAVAVASGTAALHLSSMVAGVDTQNGGITSAMTFVASANGIRYSGGVAALADIDPDTAIVTAPTLSVAADELQKQGIRARVLVPVDYAGAVADLPAIADLARRLGARVIEDAAHSLGATYRHEGEVYRAGSCTHSDFAILSFHPVKHLTTIEGGAILTRDEGAYRQLLELRSHGITRDPARMSKNDGPWYQEQTAMGYHYRLGDVPCALGLSQLKKLDRFLSRRRALAARYDAGLGDAALRATLEPLPVRHGVSSAYHLYVLRTRARPGEGLSALADRRRALYHRLLAAEIYTQVHYVPVHHHPVHHDAPRGGSLSAAEHHYSRCLSLPLYPDMRDEDVDRVLEVLAEAGAS